VLPDVVDVEHFRQLVIDVLSNLLDVLFFVDCTGRAAVASLHLQGVEPERLSSVGEVADLGVGVETKDTWAGKQGHLLDGEHEFFHVGRERDSVFVSGAREVELLVLIEDEISKELLKVGVHDAAIPVVSDATTVHRLADEIPQGLPRQVLIIRLDRLVDVQVDQAPRDLEITIVEVIADIPADLAILLSFLDGGVEEGKHVDHLFELLARAGLENLIAHLAEVLAHVGAKTIGGLSDNLETSLKDTERELVCWHRGEPQTEALVWLLQVLNDAFECFEPTCEQVTVLQHDPVTTDRTTLNVSLGIILHTLTKGQEVELAHSNAYLLDKVLDLSLRVSTGTQNEDNRGLLGRLLEHLFVNDGR